MKQEFPKQMALTIHIEFQGITLWRFDKQTIQLFMRTFVLPDFVLICNVYWTVRWSGGRLCWGATCRGI